MALNTFVIAIPCVIIKVEQGMMSRNHNKQKTAPQESKKGSS